jgi:hypothetical protein
MRSLEDFHAGRIAPYAGKATSGLIKTSSSAVVQPRNPH